MQGQPVDVLWSLPNFASGTERASSSGIPLLFPFPGRIPGTRFQWQGRDYELEAGDKLGNAIHGFCHTRPWRVLNRQDDSVTGKFVSTSDPSLRQRWPSDFRAVATYEVGAGVLMGTFTFENIGSEPLPCGFGAHPYFRVPLNRQSDAGACVVRLPVSKYWELEEMLPTGRLVDWERASDASTGIPFATLDVDGVFSGLTFTNGYCSASIHDPAGRQLTIAWDQTFRECVVFTPPHREAICIEPYTCVPNAAELAARGIDAGLRVLSPGESFRCAVQLRVS